MDFTKTWVFYNSLAAFASEDKSAIVAAGLLGGVKNLVDAAVSLAVLVVVRESGRVVAAALKISSAGSLSRWWAGRKALIGELKSSQ